MNVAKQVKPLTLEEFSALEKDESYNYELIDGIMLMSPRPSFEHQNISGNLYYELRNVLKTKDCKPIQELDLLLEGNNFVPDLMVICNEEFKGKCYEKPPLIAIEIVSPSSTSRDHITKRRKYELLGIKEYWIVSPEEKCITVFDFISGEDCMYCEGQVKSYVLPNVQINLDDIFA